MGCSSAIALAWLSESLHHWRRKLRWLLARLKEISKMELQRDDLLMKLGAL